MASTRMQYDKLGAARHARKMIGAARRAAKQLKNQHDDEALHRFRVRVRRLRAFLKTYRKPLGGERLKKPINRLGRLIDITNTSRDLQVQLGWLDRARNCRRLQPRSRDAARWMARHLASNSVGPNPVKPKYLTKQLKKITGQLDTQIGKVRKPSKKVSDAKIQSSFSKLAGRKITNASDKLTTYLAEIDGLDAQEAAHRARLIAKQLRYILEPMGKSTIDAPNAICEVRSLQDLLGELRDRQVLETEISRCLGPQAEAWSDDLKTQHNGPNKPESGFGERCLGLRDLIEELRHQQQVLYRRLDRRWLNDHGESGMQHTRAVAQALCDPAKRG